MFPISQGKREKKILVPSHRALLLENYLEKGSSNWNTHHKAEFGAMALAGGSWVAFWGLDTNLG